MSVSLEDVSANTSGLYQLRVSWSYYSSHENVTSEQVVVETTEPVTAEIHPGREETRRIICLNTSR